MRTLLDTIHYEFENLVNHGDQRYLKIVELTTEEMEAYRLRHINDLEQKQAADKMHTSQSTYQRILYSAYKKIADALINGKAIKIIKHE